MAMTPSPKNPKAEPTFKKLSTLQVVAVADLLRAKCRLIDGFAVYDDGYDDARVAAEAVPEYQGRAAHVIGQYRVKLIGPLRAAAPPMREANADLEAVWGRLTTLEKRFAALCHMFGVDEDCNALPGTKVPVDGETGTRLL